MDDTTDAMLTNLAVALADVRQRVKELIGDGEASEITRHASMWLADLSHIGDDLNELRAELRACSDDSSAS